MKKRLTKSAKGSGNPKKSDTLLIRLSSDEKEGFKIAAAQAGQALSVWVRERLRLAAQVELEGANIPVPFFPKV